MEPNNENILPLDDATIESLSELDIEIRACNFAKQKILDHFAKRHRLEGKWQIAPNGKELVKITEMEGKLNG